MSPPAIDVRDVIDVYASMGFTYTKLNRRLYRFERHPLYVNHELIRAVGVPLPALLAAAEVRGFANELGRALAVKRSLMVWNPPDGLP